MSEENLYWQLTDISYQEAVNLSASDLVKNFQRDPVRNSARFWPGSKGVFVYLSEHAPEKSLILNDKGEAVRQEQTTRELKTFPVRKPVKMGMEIADD